MCGIESEIRVSAVISPQTREWAQSRATPGKYTGARSLTPLSHDDHKVGIQAWAKKVLSSDVHPVDGILDY